MTKRFGFTLAEVLITLGIIGVVAAMTIPTLISNTNVAQFKTAYKKALSTLNQAVLMNLAMDDEDFSTLAKEADQSGTKLSALLPARIQGSLDLGTDNKSSYFKSNTNGFKLGTGDGAETPELTYQIACTATETPTVDGGSATACKDGVSTVTINMDAGSDDNYGVFNFNDGQIAFIYNKNAHECTETSAAANKCYGFIDVNGAKNPNSVIDCSEKTGTTTVPCEVSGDDVTDIYPVVFHGQTVAPASDAARAVLFGK